MINPPLKFCPKCSIEHLKPGLFCSRKCANSRVQSEEIRLKKSKTLIGRATRGPLSEKSDKERIKKFKETWLHKLLDQDFEKLGVSSKRKRLILEKDGCCDRCNLKEWQGFPLILELEHKDGNNSNNEKQNLEMLCPNCHSLTETWRGRNKPMKTGVSNVSDEDLIQALKDEVSIRQALLRVGLSAKGNNYTRAKTLHEKIKFTG